MNTISDVDGSFILGPVTLKPHKVVARFRSKDNKIYKQISTEVDLPQPKVEDVGILFAEYADLRCKGKLIGQDGKPLVGITMTMWGETFTTDANGEYETPLMPGSCTADVHITSLGYQARLDPFVFNFSQTDIPPYKETLVCPVDFPNKAPVVSLKADGYSVDVNKRVHLTATAIDPEGKPLTIKWFASLAAESLIVSGDKLSADWSAPSSSGIARFIFTAIDSEGLSNIHQVELVIGAPNQTPPALAAGDLMPKPGSMDVGLEPNLVFAFDKDILTGQGKISIFRKSDDSLVTAADVANTGQMTVAGKKATWTPDVALLPNTDYYILIGYCCFRDETGNFFPGIQDKTAWSFTTGNAPPPQPTSYLVTFNSQGGSEVVSQSVSSGGKVILPSPPTRAGYAFAGWFKEAAATNTWEFSTETITAPTTLYAKWIQIPTYSVVYNSNGSTGGAVPTDSGAYKTAATITVLGNTGNLVKTGYTFAGWNTSTAGDGDARAVASTFTMGSANVTLYAKWTINSYAVTFDSQGGTAVDTQVVSHGASATIPVAPTRAGYTFAGWYKESSATNAWNFNTDTVTSAVTLYAKWNINSYTVTFDSQGGTAVDAQVVNHGASATTPIAPTRTGYTFAGWYKESSATNVWNFNTDTITAAVTVYAKWTINSYAVTFDSQGGSAVDTQVVNHGASATIPVAPTRAGTTFAGWYKESSATNAWNFTTDTVTAAVTMYAKWTINSYAVTFDSQGGTAVDTQVVNHGASATTPVAPTRAGTTFAGWYKESSATNAWNFTTDTVTAAVTMYAKWTSIAFVQSLGTNSQTGATTTMVLTLASTAQAGDTVVVVFTTSFAQFDTAISDSAGNVWPAGFINTGSGFWHDHANYLIATKLTNPIPNGGTITVTFGAGAGSGDVMAIAAYEFSGMTGTVDQSIGKTAPPTTTTPSAGPTAVTTQAHELIFVAFSAFNAGGSNPGGVFSAGAGFTLLPGVGVFSDTHGQAICAEYKIVDTVGAQSGDGVFSVTSQFDGDVAAYK